MSLGQQGENRQLSDNPELCHQLSKTEREKTLREYSPGKYYERLTAVYKKAILLNKES